VKICDNFQFPNWKISDYNGFMQGQDIALLLKLAIQDEPNLPSKELAASLFISPSEVSKALKRCVDSGLLYISGSEKRVNRTALLDFLGHGLKYVFPPVKGSLVRGVPTAAAAEPLKSRLLEDGEPLTVWPYAEGRARGISITPLYKGAPKAALLDSRFYGVLALSDAIRSGRTRERNLAIELLEKDIHA
jgi:DNA-binding Lrp family transcriptional regulator